MTTQSRGTKPPLLVLSSTYPRWNGDHEPGFVHELSRRLGEHFEILVIAPMAPGAQSREIMDGVRIHRFRYAPVRRMETLVNDGGITANLKRSRWKYLLLPGFLLSMFFAIRSALGTHRPELIHAHWLLPQGLLAALALASYQGATPLVITSHGADLYGWRGAIFRWLKRFTIQKAAKLVVVSRAMCADLLALGAQSRQIELGPMGVDLRRKFTPTTMVRRSVCEILFVGRLVEKKGLKFLIAAMPAILSKYPAAALSVVGFGPEEKKCKAHVASLGLEDSVSFVGAVSQSDLPALYRRATVFVAPFVEAQGGDRDGLGLVAVEAAACGCPVVISRLPAVTDIFGEHEAIFVTSRDSTQLSDAIIRVFADPANAPRATRSMLLDKFDWVAVAANYLNLLDEVRG